MNGFFKTLIAGYGAKKLGGGCFSTILIFFVIYWALGTCDRNRASSPAPSNTNNQPVKKPIEKTGTVSLPGSLKIKTAA